MALPKTKEHASGEYRGEAHLVEDTHQPPHADAERFECLHHIPVESVAQPRLGDLLDTRQLGVRMDGGLEGAAVALWGGKEAFRV